MNNELISIIIINKNDPNITNTLESLASIEAPAKFEIIVVDASSGKYTYIKAMYSQIKWIDYESKPYKPISIPEQRNFGIKASKGNIIVFIDANCIPADKNWLTALCAPIIVENENIVRGSIANSANYYQTTDLIENKHYVNESPTINIAISRSVFNKVGYFDDSFKYGSDIDFSWRAIEHGYKIRYVENAAILHDFGSFKNEVVRSYYYGEGRPRLYRKHKGKYRLYLNEELKSILYLIIICLSPFISLLMPSYMILLTIFFVLHFITGRNLELFKRIAFAAGILKGYISQI